MTTENKRYRVGAIFARKADFIVETDSLEHAEIIYDAFSNSCINKPNGVVLIDFESQAIIKRIGSLEKKK